MANIKLIFTGGTIASVATKNGILPSLSEEKPMLLGRFERDYSELNEEVRFECTFLMNKLSENMELSNWEQILQYLKSSSFDKFDGIIIAYGTDTLGFFANMLSVFENDLPPVYIVSSDKVLSDNSANGAENFACAVKKIVNGKTEHGVFVPYRNGDGKMIIHKGYQITQSSILSNDFYSLDSNPPEHKSLKKFSGFKKGVLLLNSYVGMDLSVIDFSNISTVIVTAYHGGTTNEKELIDLVERSSIKVLLASVNYNENENKYASTVRLQKHGVKIIYKKTVETAYAEELCSLI